MKYMPNILIVKGSGRNVGKTVSACRIIRQLAESHAPVGIKISPHFHRLDEKQKFIHFSPDFVIVEEQNINGKDSSRMLQAGAKKVFYIQAKNDYLPQAVEMVLQQINSMNPVVIESGGLYDFWEPGLLVYIEGEELKRESNIRPHSTVIRLSSDEAQNFDWKKVYFDNGKFTIDA